MKKDYIATLKDVYCGIPHYYHYYETEDSVVRVDEWRNEVERPDWAYDILTEDLENMGIEYLNPSILNHYLTEEDIKDGWKDPEEVMKKIRAYANPKAVFVLGLKWYDKVNGNTYCRPVVFLDNGERITCEYAYGYGDQYMEYARKLCKENGITIKFPAHTDKWVSKKELKDEMFF